MNAHIFAWFLKNVMAEWRHEWVQLECERKREAWEWSGAENWMFAYQDARVLHSIVRHFKPSRVVEIGSGFSTRIGTAAMELNKKDGQGGKYLIIEPFPNRVPNPLPGLCRPDCVVQDFMEKVVLIPKSQAPSPKTQTQRSRALDLEASASSPKS